MAEVTINPTTANPPSIATADPTTTAASLAPTPKKRAPGLTFKRFFTKAGVSPYDELEWELRLAQITDSHGGIIFEQKDVEVPQGLVDDGDQHRRQQISARPARHSRARDRRAPARDPRRRNHSRLGHQGRILPQRRRRGHLP